MESMVYQQKKEKVGENASFRTDYQADHHPSPSEVVSGE